MYRHRLTLVALLFFAACSTSNTAPTSSTPTTVAPSPSTPTTVAPSPSTSPAESASTAAPLTPVAVEFAQETPFAAGSFLTVVPPRDSSVLTNLSWHTVLLVQGLVKGSPSPQDPVPSWASSVSPDPLLRTPSLAVALAMLDASTEGDLTSGMTIAAAGSVFTGGILVDLSQKQTAAVLRNSGADVVFLSGPHAATMEGVFSAHGTAPTDYRKLDPDTPMDIYSGLKAYQEAGARARLEHTQHLVSVTDIRQAISYLAGLSQDPSITSLAATIASQRVRFQLPGTFGDDGVAPNDPQRPSQGAF